MMYGTIAIILGVLTYLFILISPFIKSFREKYAEFFDGSPFEVYQLIEDYIHGSKRHYEEVSEGHIILMYCMGNVVLGLMISFMISLVWPVSLFALLISIILKITLNKLKKDRK